MDWYRFWNQFQAEIDNASIDSVTKFSYLKELLLPKVRLSIDGLPLTTEGYERAKKILNSTYGKSSEIINAYVQNITSLPLIKGGNAANIQEFYEKLLISVQALESMGKLGEIKGLTRGTLDKLEGIRADLVRTDDNWQEWGFPKLVNALKQWTERNPSSQDDRGGAMNFRETNHNIQKREKFFQARQQWRKRSCVYCEGDDHKSTECRKVTEICHRREHLKKRRLCFNCTGANHRAAECRVRSGCQRCGAKHHTSICDKRQDQFLLASGEQRVIYPIVIVTVNGVRCRALLDTGAGSSYISEKLVSILGKRLILKQNRQIDMMLSTVNKKIEIYQVEIQNLQGDFKLEVEASKVDREELLSVKNPKYQHVVKKYKHLHTVTMDDISEKTELPVHLILGASEYARIKTSTNPFVGKPGEPVAEYTKFGWTIISPGEEIEIGKFLFAKSSTVDYEKLCSLDVLGLKDADDENQSSIFEEFNDQLERKVEGFYETGLMWKSGETELPNNRLGSLARLGKLVQKLERDPELFSAYDKIMKDQEAEGIIEEANGEGQGKVFYLPHRPVIREKAETTKIRIVYDASARENNEASSLNECLETGSPLQNMIWDIMTRNRLRPITVAGDLKQAFLQIRIRESDRDALRFHWLKDKDKGKIGTYRFTRVIFGLNQSPFLLGGTIEHHLRNEEKINSKAVEEIRKSIYVDDVILSGDTLTEVKILTMETVKIFERAGFQLHKWHSNVKELEEDQQNENVLSKADDESYAKQQLGDKKYEAKLLGLKWDKYRDTLAITFPAKQAKYTRRAILQRVASIYDPLGIVSPVTLEGKLIYRKACDAKVPWDQELPNELLNEFKSWENSLPDEIEVPRSIAKYSERVESIVLHGFGDASKHGISAAVYAIVHQKSGSNVELLVAKSRLAKKDLSIPRLELVAGHLVANMLESTTTALAGIHISGSYAWLDSSVALYWIEGKGQYKQFVGNRVKAIQKKSFIKWKHVPSEENPADIGSRGCKANKIPTRWFEGPKWLLNKDTWPQEIEITASEETEKEVSPVKKLLRTANVEKCEIDQVLEKHNFWKAMRILGWIGRFIHNCRVRKGERTLGQLTTQDIQSQIELVILRAQRRFENNERFKSDRERLNLQKNDKGIFICKGRIEGDYPVYLRERSLLTDKIVEHCHLQTLHGGVSITMTEVRRNYWVPKLRQRVKSIRHRCHGCKRFHTKAFSQPPSGLLPEDRTKVARPFEIVGVDYAGPIIYRATPKSQGKAYILLIACSLTRGIYIDVVTEMTTEEFMARLKAFIARRGRPKVIYSDNARTFQAAASRIKSILHSEKLNDLLARNEIKWRFNLSRAPWWGGQYETLIGIVKQSLYRVAGRALLKLKELKEVLMDVETVLNNRPLSYVEDDVELQELTPNVMILGKKNALLDEEVHTLDGKDLRKRAKYLEKCKNNIWKRWSDTYLKSLRERHNMKLL